jgi:hypothetical protein
MGGEWGCIFNRGKILLFSEVPHTYLGLFHFLLYRVLGSFMMDKEREARSRHPSSAEDKKAWS